MCAYVQEESVTHDLEELGLEVLTLDDINGDLLDVVTELLTGCFGQTYV